MKIATILIAIIGFTACSSQQVVIETDPLKFRLAFPNETKSTSSRTFDEIEGEIDKLNSVIGRYPPKYKTVEERENVYAYWVDVLLDAKALYKATGESENSLYILSELYRQGHNMDVVSCFSLAKEYVEKCRNKYPLSVSCHRSAMFFFLQTDPKLSSKAKPSLDFVRSHSAPGKNEEAERGYIFFYIHAGEKEKAIKQIDNYLEYFPNSKNKEKLIKMRTAIKNNNIKVVTE